MAARNPIRVLNLLFHHPPTHLGPDEVLDGWPTLVGNVRALASRGVAVSSYLTATFDRLVVRDGSEYHFIEHSRFDRRIRRPAICSRIGALQADLIHVHGLGFGAQLWWLARATRLPVVVQDHKDAPACGWRARVQAAGIGRSAAVLFTAREQAEPFFRERVLQPSVPVYEVLEASTDFEPVERAAAREVSGVKGNPSILWVGHLDRNKDPATAVRALSRCRERLVDPQLWLCYGSGAGEEELRSLAGELGVSGNVHFVGTVAHNALPAFFSAADLFVSASHREGSGYALIEALACGLEPVVTDIPSFRRITRHGSVGELFGPGDDAALADAIVAVAARTSRARRSEIRAHFERLLSWDAVGGELERVYRRTIGSG